MNRRPLGYLGLAATLVIALALAACGGKSDSDGSSSDTTSSVTADLRLLGGDPITLDPALAGDAGSATYIVEIFGGLVSLDPNLRIIPDIAEALPTAQNGGVVSNADGTVSYTFKIRRDAMFHDGRPVTAEDFKYSFERALDPKTLSTVAEAYLGDIVGARDLSRGRATSLSGVQVVDSSTLRITIDGPKPYFLAKLTYPTAFVVDKTQIAANPRNWTRKPNGTGPYKLQDFRLNERIILQANDRYHLGAPPTKRILFNLAGGSSLTQYENGEIDASGIGLNDIERVQSTRDPLSQEYVTGQNLSISYIGFNTKTPPFDDPKVRLAFAKAINRDQIARVVLKDMLPVANSIMQPGLPGYNKDASAPTFDPAAAKQLLDESKYGGAKNLPQITLSEIGGGATAGFDTQAMIEMWKTNLGVDVAIAQSEEASFFDDLDRGRLQMFSIGWIMDYPDPEDIIDLLFYSKSRQNNTGYNSPEFDDLVVKARTEQDVEKRLQLYRDAEQVLLQDVPWMPLYFGKDHFVVKPYVKGFGPSPIVIPRLRYVTVEKR